MCGCTPKEYQGQTFRVRKAQNTSNHHKNTVHQPFNSRKRFACRIAPQVCSPPAPLTPRFHALFPDPPTSATRESLPRSDVYYLLTPPTPFGISRAVSMLMHAKSHQASQGGGEGAGEFVGAIDIASAIRSSSAEELFTTSGSLGGWSNGGSGADAAPPAHAPSSA